MQKFFVPVFAVVGSVVAITGFHVFAEGVGYKDTPMLPGQPWHVHDSDRPVPHSVTRTTNS